MSTDPYNSIYDSLRQEDRSVTVAPQTHRVWNLDIKYVDEYLAWRAAKPHHTIFEFDLWMIDHYATVKK